MTIFSLQLRTKIKESFVQDNTEGQGLPEYALILFLVSIASLAALSTLGITIHEQLYQVILAMLPF